MNFQQIRTTICPFLIFILLLTSCVTSNLEYDRMTGTAFPIEDTDSAGNSEDLTSIFVAGGHLLTIDLNQTNIAPLNGTPNPLDPDEFDYITTAEVQTLALANRSFQVDADTSYTEDGKQIRKYFVYGIVVDHFRERDDGSRSTGSMGLMYDPLLRSAFVNYYKNSINRTQNNLFLRSTAHEIGHAFNLSHGDGDGSTTIMNQTRDISETTFIYEFSSTSLDHLQNHPLSTVYPGIGPRHYATPHSH